MKSNRKVEFNLEKTPFRLHPAFLVWKSIHPESHEPLAIEILTRKKGKPLINNTLIYRLSGVGINGSAVIAKMQSLRSLNKEKLVYEKLLPSVPVSSLHFYGFAVGEKETAWIFLEKGHGRRYSAEIEGDRILAAKWLGAFHSCTGQMDNDFQLGVNEIERNLDRLNEGLDSLHTSLAKLCFQSSHILLLEKILVDFNVISSNWHKITQLCDRAPKCIVHRDFIAKNVVVSTSERENILSVFDWECVGWGIPAMDLGALDYTLLDMGGRDVIAYQMAIANHWPDVDKVKIQEWIDVGLILRYIDWISKTVELVTPEWLDKPFRSLANYHSSLNVVLKRLGWI